MALDEKLTEQIHELRELTRNSSEDFIDEKKKERKDRINQKYHPFSIGEPKFPERQQLNEY